MPFEDQYQNRLFYSKHGLKVSQQRDISLSPSLPTCVYIYIYIYVCLLYLLIVIHMYMYVYIYIERERDMCMNIYIYILLLKVSQARESKLPADRSNSDDASNDISIYLSLSLA